MAKPRGRKRAEPKESAASQQPAATESPLTQEQLWERWWGQGVTADEVKARELYFAVVAGETDDNAVSNLLRFARSRGVSDEGIKQAATLIVYATHFLAGPMPNAADAPPAEHIAAAFAAVIGGQRGKDNAAKMRLVAELLEMKFVLHRTGKLPRKINRWAAEGSPLEIERWRLPRELASIDSAFSKLSPDVGMKVLHDLERAKDRSSAMVDAVLSLCENAKALGVSIEHARGTPARRRIQKRVREALYPNAKKK